MAGTNFASPTDLGSPETGSYARYDFRDIATMTGTIHCNQSIAPSAGTYDLRWVAAGNNSQWITFTNSSCAWNVT